MTRLGFKFLARGAFGPVSEYRWPQPDGGTPGAWVEAASGIEVCRSGVHVCGADELAHWLHDELWIVELDGVVVPGIDCMVAERGRLVRRVEAWTHGGAARFARAARDHAAERVGEADELARARLTHYVADSSAHLPRGSTALAAFCAAMAVAYLHGGSRFDDAGYRAERLWQSRFIADDLQLAI